MTYNTATENERLKQKRDELQRRKSKRAQDWLIDKQNEQLRRDIIELEKELGDRP